MNQTPSPTASSGHLFMVVRLPGPNPPPNPVTIIEQRLQDGVLRMTYLPAGTINAQLVRSAEGVETIIRELTSCAIDNPEVRACLVNVSWTPDGEMQIGVNDQTVGSTRSKAKAVTSYTIPPKPSRELQQEEFARENKLAISDRRDKWAGMAGSQPKRNRRRMEPDYMIGALRNEILLIEDSLQFVERGETHHVISLARSLRTVIAEANQLPLLQLCAAIVDAPLIIYTSAQPQKLPPAGPDQSLRFDISATPTDLFNNSVDLDVWLKLPAGQISENSFSHRELIMAVGNTVAAHVTQDVHVLVQMLRNINAQFFGEFDSDGLAQFIRLVAKATLQLARSLIEQYNSSQTT